MFVYFIVMLFVVLISNGISKKDSCYLYANKRDIVNVGHSISAKRLFIFSAIVLVCIAGLRYNVGADFWAYYSGVSRRASELVDNLKNYSEPGISFICWIATKISPSDPRATGIFLEAAITISLMLYTIFKNSEYLSESLLLYVFLVWSSCFNGIRQLLAASILFFGLPYLRERRFFKYVITVLIASLFHKSVLVMLVIYFFVGNKVSFKNSVIILLGSFVILFSYDRVFELLGQLMLDVDTTSYAYRSVNNLRILVSCTPAIVFFIFGIYKNTDDDNYDDTSFYFNISLIHAALAIASSSSSYFARVSMYTDPFMVVAIPKLCGKLNNKNRNIVVNIMLVLYAIFWLYGRYKDETERIFTFIWQR